ncbi:hypothetical protein CDAR_1271 [Caerostris darwini]|uniref:Peptidase M10 metallopeptidase domain-containing protein n=1 Tax=Caerostris darwini TaxID=1538125 RepID=A0AAV4U1E6_9ARAC|nr:hypothetical protein CDAR_1271 [Caerostris darwini]
MSQPEEMNISPEVMKVFEQVINFEEEEKIFEEMKSSSEDSQKRHENNNSKKMKLCNDEISPKETDFEEGEMKSLEDSRKREHEHDNNNSKKMKLCNDEISPKERDFEEGEMKSLEDSRKREHEHDNNNSKKRKLCNDEISPKETDFEEGEMKSPEDSRKREHEHDNNNSKKMKLCDEDFFEVSPKFGFLALQFNNNVIEGGCIQYALCTADVYKSEKCDNNWLNRLATSADHHFPKMSYVKTPEEDFRKLEKKTKLFSVPKTKPKYGFLTLQFNHNIIEGGCKKFALANEDIYIHQKCDNNWLKRLPVYIEYFVNSNPTWNKNYLTWSLVNGTNYSFLDDVIEMWNIEPSEFARVDPGKGDINIYFKTIASEHVMGYAHYPEEGKVFINDKLKPNQVFYVLQHEFGHALGLTHDPNQNSTMFPYFLGETKASPDLEKGEMKTSPNLGKEKKPGEEMKTSPKEIDFENNSKKNEIIMHLLI